MSEFNPDPNPSARSSKPRKATPHLNGADAREEPDSLLDGLQLDEEEDAQAPRPTSSRSDRVQDLEDAVLADDGAIGVANLVTTVYPVGQPPDFFRVRPGPDQSCVLVGLMAKGMDK